VSSCFDVACFRVFSEQMKQQDREHVQLCVGWEQQQGELRDNSR
jgi:hypothetical protein